ncbi:MAG: hypothetical protein GY937_06810 [bacterium]|nr:hypothetical protein [bacterium]
MEVIAPYFLTAGRVVFCVAGLMAGIHAIRNRRAAPDGGAHILAAWAIALSSGGMLVFPIATAVESAALGRGLFIAGESLLRGGFVLLACFVWRAFRPDETLGLVAAMGSAAGLIATFAWELKAQTDLPVYHAGLASAWAAQYSYALPLAWSAVEACREWLNARRRVAFGLAEPFNALVFLLWTICTSSLVVVCLLANGIAWAEAEGDVALAAGLTVARGLHYLPCLVAVWVGFFPPAWLRARYAMSEAG